MHELAVCQSLIQQLEDIVAQHNAKKVSVVTVGIGPLSGVEPQLLQNAFPISRVDSVAEEAELLIEHLKIRVKCSQCGAESDAKVNKLICAQCGDWRTTLISGDEMLLMQVELEKTSPAFSNA